MDLDIVFLGTAGSVPTPARGLSASLVRRGGHRILIDCGEGTQRQMMRSTGLADVDTILITHAHADHFLGLPGILKTFNLRERELPLTVVGPPGFIDLYAVMRRIIGKLSYKLELQEAAPGWLLHGDGYDLVAFPTEHTVASTGYMLREHERPGRFDVDEARRLGVPEGPAWGRLQRGEAVTLDGGTTVTPQMVLGETRTSRRIIFTGDTRATDEIRDVAQGADVLVHEATFSSEEAQRARQTGHSTATDAALTGLAADVGMLAITHLSNRYTGRELHEEARAIFPRTVCPRDFDLIDVPYRERGEPTLVKGGGRSHNNGATAPSSGSETTLAGAETPGLPIT